MLIGELIRLRPVQRADLPLLDAHINDPDAIGIYNMFSLTPQIGGSRDFEEHGFLDDRHGMLLVIDSNDEVVGDVSYRQVNVYGPGYGSVAYAIGINLLKAARGKGYSTEAQRLMAAYLFATYPTGRVEATTDITNLPEQRSLEKAGFIREGVLRQSQWRNGERHDMVLYSKLRGE